MSAKAGKKGSFRDYLAAAKDLGGDAVTLVYGSSEHLMHRTVDLIRARATKDGVPAVSLEAASITEATLQAMGGQASLFEPATLYVIRRVEQAKSLPKLLKGAAAGKDLANKLVFVYKGDSPVAPLKAELKRMGAREVPCFDPWPNELPQVVGELAKDAGLKLKADAVQLLVETNGGDLVKQANEITKLALLTRSGGDATAPLGAADVAPHLGMLREDDAFQLDKLLLAKQWAKAHALAASLLARGEKGLAVLGIIAGHCRNVVRIADALASGVPAHDLGARVKMPPFLIKTYAQGVGRVDPRRYLRALELCRETDRILKSAPISEELVIARLIDALAVG